MSDDYAYRGTEDGSSNSSDFKSTNFMIQQAIEQLATCTVVEVTGVTTTGEASPVGFVHVRPLVNMVDGYGNATEHGTIYNVPFSRVQGGKNALIVDPQVGDRGTVTFASRDISSVKANRGGPANPGSHRTYDWADAIYHHGTLNEAPERWVRFPEGGGIEIAVKSGESVAIVGNLTVTGSITAGQGTGDSVTLQQHKHAGGPVPDPGT